jgi:two-component system sensor histidine kinase HydH
MFRVRPARTISKLLLPLVVAALPVVLLLSSLRTLRELDEQKTVYLRSRVAAVAGRLENLPPSVDAAEAFDALSEDEPYLLDLALIERNSPAGAQSRLAPLWSGQELYRTEMLNSGGRRIFRAYVPFHSVKGLRIARIDLDAAVADFLLVHARHNVIVASAGGLVLVVLALYAVWATRRAARLELRQLELEHLAHMGEMAAVLAHEIRNPLGTIKGFAQLAGERAGPAVQALLEPILSETARLEELVNELLLYARPQQPALRRTPWRETVAAIEAHARQLIGQRAIAFHADAPALEWETDPNLLQQALLNLVRNAVEAIPDPDGGEVRIELRRLDAGGVAIAVIDNGPGLSSEVRRRLFEPFFTTKASGTGLGLSITRKLAQALGGDFTIRPAAPRGAEAVLSFPRAAVQAAGSE